MKNRIAFFNLLKIFSMFQKLRTNDQRENTRTVLRTLKFLFVLPFLLSTFFTVHVMAAFDDGTLNNDTCPSEENLTISDGVNYFSGVIENNGEDYYQVIIPEDGNITITWETVQTGKEASLWVGTDCNDSSIYAGDDAKNKHITETFEVNATDVIYIKIFNGEGKGYTLTIDYDIDIGSVAIVEPSFCYDYSYDQNDLNLSKANPGYISDTVSLPPAPDVHINLYLKLLDNNYSSVKNVVVDIIDINATQAHYARESVWLKKPGRFFSEKIDDADLNVSDTYINDIQVGTMIKSDFFAIDYDITPQITDLHFPVNATITYDLPVPTVSGAIATISSSQSILGDNIPICPEPGSGYAPAYSIFNVEDNLLNNSNPAKYNLLTQTVNRVDDLEIVSYNINNPDSKNAVSSFVGIELIDVNDVADFPNACSNPNNAISPRIWIPFLDTTAAEGEDSNVTQVSFNRQTLLDAIANGTTSDQILNVVGNLSTPEDFYGIANENTAFRIVYSAVGDDEGLLRVLPTRQGLRLDNFNELIQEYKVCKQPVKNPQNNIITDSVPVACSNDGNNLTLQEIATCMECLYGYDTRFLCSRDNFAIRPESFRIKLSDQDQNSPTTPTHIKTNINNSQINIAAGYQYVLEVNATNHQNDNSTPGYSPSYPLDGSDGNRTFRLKESFTVDKIKCNDLTDRNKTATFINGVIDLNLSSTQVGEYNLTIEDKLWTRVDWDDSLMGHHTGIHFSTGDDCNLTSSYVPTSADTATMNGCIITSNNHSNSDNSLTYTDIPLRVHPYKFNLDNIDPNIGPYTRSSTHAPFVYINNPPTVDINNTNMSYNMNGTFYASGYDDGNLSNFVKECYADDVNMDLNFTYNSPEPPVDKEPFLSYSLKDHNISDTTEVIRPVSVYDFEIGTHNSSTTIFTIPQGEEFFVKEMNGSITMDLGYNFKRDYNNTLNPRYIEFKDFNITHVINSITPTNIYADLTNDHKIFGNKDLDDNVTFVYGRAKPSQYFYDDVTANFIDTPISVVIHCNQDPITCSAVYNHNNIGRKTDEYDWFLSVGHVTNENDGNITLNSSTDASVAPSDSSSFPINFNGGVNNPNVRVTATAVDRPLDINITFGTNTNSWLIYNEDKNEIPIPFYRVRFIGQSGWAGAGDTGHTVDGETSIQKNRRLGW